MFHIAKILEVMSPSEKGAKNADASSFALLEMWDENMLIFKISPSISGDVKEGSFVLVDYSPVAVGGTPVPRHEVTVILSDSKGKKFWHRMKEYMEKRKPSAAGQDSFLREAHPGKMVG